MVQCSGCLGFYLLKDNVFMFEGSAYWDLILIGSLVPTTEVCVCKLGDLFIGKHCF
jgi:hypothetical protein